MFWGGMALGGLLVGLLFAVCLIVADGHLDGLWGGRFGRWRGPPDG